MRAEVFGAPEKPDRVTLNKTLNDMPANESFGLGPMLFAVNHLRRFVARIALSCSVLREHEEKGGQDPSFIR